jgi:diguanylate cyclase (GGDEF)-like protein/PAS domain S-box-containing protein
MILTDPEWPGEVRDEALRAVDPPAEESPVSTGGKTLHVLGLRFNPRTWISHLAISLTFLGLYLLVTRPEVINQSEQGMAVWYPATGLVFALLLGVSPWYAPLVCFADVMAEYLHYHTPIFGWNLLGTMGVAATYAVSAVLLRGPWRIETAAKRRRDVARYLVVSLGASAVATLFGVGAMLAAHAIKGSVFLAAFVWFSGDLTALLSVAPAFLLIVIPRVQRHLDGRTETQRRSKARGLETASAARVAEAVGQAAAITLTIWAMFRASAGSADFYFLVFVPIIWIAMRNGMQRVAVGILTLNMGIALTMSMLAPDDLVFEKVGLLMLTVSATGLIVGAVVSEHQYAQRALEDQASYLHSLVDNSPYGIVVLDEKRRVRLCNQAFRDLVMSGNDSLAGRDWETLIAAQAGDNYEDFSRSVLAGELVHRQIQHVRSDGAELDLELHAVPLKRDGRVQGAYAIFKDISAQTRAEQESRVHADTLAKWIAELQVRTDQMSLLNRMGEFLQASANAEEAFRVVSTFAGDLLPEASAGALFELKASRNILEQVAHWGGTIDSEPVFTPEQCWAVRLGRSHWSDPKSGTVVCSHAVPGSACLCIPLMMQGDLLGVLHLVYPVEASAGASDAEDQERSRQRMALTVAGQVALSLANLKLREKLRDQSLRDPLTGLFNRRFFEESLDRELRRATRKKSSLALLFIDIDHFKKFNDSFGHDAGDMVLQEVAEVFREHFRSEDVVCRFGGEEFAVLLPDSGSTDAYRRAEELRAKVESRRLEFRGRSLDRVTISIGIADVPEHAATPEELLRAADQSLYFSKRTGRNRVTISTRALVV